MSQLLQPLSIFDFTPPASPTKLSNPMKWLTRTPSSVPLPPSPTKSREGLDDDSKSASSTDSSTLTQANFTRAMRSLQKKSSSFLLQPKASSSSLQATPLDAPQREVPHGLSRPSPARAITSASELGDHFARALPTHEEKQAELRRRREASQKRVQEMRAYLSTSTSPNSPVQAASANAPHPSSRIHQRYDSASHEHADSDNAALHQPPKPHATHASATISQTPEPHPTDPRFLPLALFRLRCRPPLRYHCVGCKQTHGSSIQGTASLTWLTTSCRHYVHSGCFSRLRDADGTDTCVHCVHLRRRLGQLSPGEVEAGYESLLGVTGFVG